MSLAVKVYALMQSLSDADIKRLSPFERRQLADICKHIAAMAERETAPAPPKAGFIAELGDGRGRE